MMLPCHKAAKSSLNSSLKSGLGPLWRLQALAAHGLMSLHKSADLRCAAAAFGLRALAALDAFVERRLSSLAQNVIERALAGARFAVRRVAADSTVAAGSGQGLALFQAIGSFA
jgi:hypothetical protein